MNRAEFMQQLSELLSEISPTEREEALQYYKDYFDDAGVENEASVIEELGTPEKVAQTIKADLLGKTTDDWEFTEAGCTNMGGRPKAAVVKVEENSRHSQQQYNNQYNNQYKYQYGNGAGQQTETGKKKTDVGKIILVTLLILITSPLWISVGSALIGIIIAIAAVIASLLLALLLLSAAFIISGIFLFGLSFPKMFVSPLLGFMTMGISLLILGLGIFALIVSIGICGTVIPALFRGIINLCRRPFHKNGKQGEKGGQPA